MTRLTPVIVILALSACSGTPADGCETHFSEEEIPDDLNISLSRTACFGSCPVYRVHVFADGRVEYFGTEFVAETGNREKSLDISIVKDLIAAFDEAKFFCLSNSYQPGESTCLNAPTDQPTTATSILFATSFKEVSHYRGCEQTEDLNRLTVLENEIDEKLNTAEWIE